MLLPYANSLCIGSMRFQRLLLRSHGSLSKLPSVTEVDRVDGPYDIIVKLSGDNIDTIKESIGKHMTRIRGIQSTLTLMAD